MKLFFDNTFPPRLVHALRFLLEGEHRAEHLRARFAPETPDDEWLRKLGSEGGWVILSSDDRIRKNPHLRAAWKQAGLTTFFLSRWSMHSFWDIAWRFFQVWPRIVTTAQRATAGEAFHVPFGRSWHVDKLRDP